MNIKNISIFTAVLAGIAGVLWIAQRSSSPSLKSDLVGQGLLNAEAIGDAQSIQIFETAEDKLETNNSKKCRYLGFQNIFRLSQ